jgi:hypothetical protein
MNSPTQQILADCARVTNVTDRSGRELCVRPLSALDRLRLFKAIGPDLAENAPYVGMALLAISVTNIDNIPVPAPMTEGQIEALVQRLGDDGLAAVSDALLSSPSEKEEQRTAGN